jgi:hypothetical protein
MPGHTSATTRAWAHCISCFSISGRLSRTPRGFKWTPTSPGNTPRTGLAGRFTFTPDAAKGSKIQICYEINHTGGVGKVEQVYVLPARHWKNGQAPGMPRLPKGAPLGRTSRARISPCSVPPVEQ